MANVKISQLPAATSLAGDALLEVVQNGENKKATLNDIQTLTTESITAQRTALSINNVDNTSDANKPVSTAQQTALDGKANTTHSHAIADVTGLQSALDGKAATSHTHNASQISDFSEAVDDEVASLLVAGSNVTLTYNGAANTLTIALASSPNVSGSFSDSKGNVRDLPVTNRTAAYTAALTDTGGIIRITTGGVTIPSDVFSPSQAFSIMNNSASNQTITQGSGVTLRFSGTGSTGNRTLAQYGLCTVTCVASNEFIISGPGLT
jgi:hypothetical protein